MEDVLRALPASCVTRATGEEQAMTGPSHALTDVRVQEFPWDPTEPEETGGSSTEQVNDGASIAVPFTGRRARKKKDPKSVGREKRKNEGSQSRW